MRGRVFFLLYPRRLARGRSVEQDPGNKPRFPEVGAASATSIRPLHVKVSRYPAGKIEWEMELEKDLRRSRESSIATDSCSMRAAGR